MVTDSSAAVSHNPQFNSHSEILDDESLFRAVRPWKKFIKRNGRLSPAAFKDAKGLSLDRCGDREELKVISDFKIRKFEGTLVSLNAGELRFIDIFLKPDPKHWIYHVLALDSPTVIQLSDEKCDKLRFMARIITTL